MNRDYEGLTTDRVSHFIGREVENTPAYGLETLFIVPDGKSTDEIIQIIKKHESEVENVYLNANHFMIEDDIIHPGFGIDWHAIFKHIENCSYIKFFTIEIFDQNSIQQIHPLLDKYQKLIINVSIQIPFAEKHRQRISLKIDDVTFKATNPGVWSCVITDIMAHSYTFTPWEQYKKDRIIE